LLLFAGAPACRGREGFSVPHRPTGRPGDVLTLSEAAGYLWLARGRRAAVDPRAGVTDPACGAWLAILPGAIRDWLGMSTLAKANKESWMELEGWSVLWWVAPWGSQRERL